ncbi:hypothetical protein [Acidisoma sp. C75]
MRLAATIFALCTAVCLMPTALHAQSAASGTAAPAATPQKPAEPKTPSAALAALGTMVTNMGYTPHFGSSGTWFSIDYTAKNAYKIAFALSPDKSVLYLYISYGVSAAQQAEIPTLRLLQWSDIHRDYFSISKDKTQVSLNMNMPVVQLTPKILREALSLLGSDADDSDKIFYPGNWK